jgi:hypothetical protein
MAFRLLDAVPPLMSERTSKRPRKNTMDETRSRRAKTPKAALATLWLPLVVALVLFVADRL